MEETPVDFSGKWRLTKNENFDEYSAAVGMPWMARKMASKATPEMIVEQNGTHFKVTFKTMVMTQVQEFDVGVEFDFEPPKSGVKLKSVPRFEGNKLVVEATPENPDKTNMISQTTVRELNGLDETIMTVTAKCKDREGEVQMKRYFSRIK